ncbi:MAG TPA: inner membrane protein YhjD [Pseudonocardiaceae bacterium]|jgi:membrane protein
MSGTTGQQPDSNEAQQPGLLERYRHRYPWLDHLVRAGETYTNKHGDHYAAAITYFSVLSLVPLLMVAFAVAGFVLAGDQHLLGELQQQIKTSVPSTLGQLLSDIVQEAIDSRRGIGITGLLVAMYSGLGWMSNLREALTAIWDQRYVPQGFLRTKMVDLVALFGLGVALLVSFGLTGAGTAFAGSLLDLAGLGHLFWARLIFYLLALVLSVAATWLVFLWVIARLPRQPVTLRSAIRAAAVAAVGFEVLKQAFAIYLDSVTASPTGRLFGPVIGLMVFAYFVSRFLLFVTAWAATSTENLTSIASPPPSGSSAGSSAGARTEPGRVTS